MLDTKTLTFQLKDNIPQLLKVIEGHFLVKQRHPLERLVECKGKGTFSCPNIAAEKWRNKTRKHSELPYRKQQIELKTKEKNELLKQREEIGQTQAEKRVHMDDMARVGLDVWDGFSKIKVDVDTESNRVEQWVKKLLSEVGDQSPLGGDKKRRKNHVLVWRWMITRLSCHQITL